MSVRTITVTTFAAGLVLAALTLLVPIPLSWHDTPVAFHMPLASTALFTVWTCGAAALFIMSLKAYKPNLQRAYRGIAASITLIALGSLQLPIMDGFNLWDSIWSEYAIDALPYIASGLILYVSTRQLAQLVGVTSPLTSPMVAGVLVVGGALGSVLLPHGALQVDSIAFRASNGIVALCALFFLVSAIIILQIARHIGVHYVRAMLSLFSALSAGTLILAAILVNALRTGTSHGVAPLILITLPLLGTLFLQAGYIFTEAERY